MGDVQIQPDYPRGITFEQVWAALMENREQLRENTREIKEAQIGSNGAVWQNIAQ